MHLTLQYFKLFLTCCKFSSILHCCYCYFSFTAVIWLHSIPLFSIALEGYLSTQRIWRNSASWPPEWNRAGMFFHCLWLTNWLGNLWLFIFYNNFLSLFLPGMMGMLGCILKCRPPCSRLKNYNLLSVQMVRVVSPAGETGMLVVDSVVISGAYDSKLVFLSYHLSCYLLYYAIL